MAENKHRNGVPLAGVSKEAPASLRPATPDMSALDRAETAVHSSEMQLHLVTENVPAMIVYFDRNFVCGFSNAQYAKFLGLRISLLIHTWQSCGGPQIAARQPRSYGERTHIRRGNKNKADTMPKADRRELTLLLL